MGNNTRADYFLAGYIKPNGRNAIELKHIYNNRLLFIDPKLEDFVEKIADAFSE